MKKILVTGGAGFIGSEFVNQAVERGDRVIVLDNLTYAGDLRRLKGVDGEYKFYKGDVGNNDLVANIFEKEKPDIVTHFAAESHVDRSILDASPFIDSNIKGTLVLLDNTRNHNVEKFINISTDEVYGELGEENSFTEFSPLEPNSPYSVSKAAQDMLGRAYFRTHGVPVITLRPSNNYGPWQYPEKLIPVVIYKALNSEPIPVYKNGMNIREWLYISDCVDAVFSIIEKGKIGEIYNIGSGEEKRNIDVVKAILKVLGKSEDLISFVKDRPGHDYRYSLNTDKIRNALEWKTKIKFEEGLRKTIKWYEHNIEWASSKR
jgi:dTDP-glucose 4,6-dehydratase